MSRTTLVLITGFLTFGISSLAYSQNDSENQNQTNLTKSKDSADQKDAKKNKDNSHSDGSNPDSAAPPLATSSAAGATVEFQKGCRVQIKGLQGVSKTSLILIKEANSSSVIAKFIGSSNGSVIASVSGDNCKKKLKGLSAELSADPETLPLQVTTTYEPQSSGWHRAKRPGAWTVGLGSGLGIGQGFMPLVRFELGASYVTSSLLFSIESGSRKTSDFDVANVATALEIQQFLGNSFYLSLGFVTENLVGSFTPIKSYDGILKQTDEYSGRYSSSVKGIEIGFGNRWQWGGFSLATEWVGYRGAMTRNDDIKLVSITPEAIPDATIALNKNYITDKTPANLRILMTRFLYSF